MAVYTQAGAISKFTSCPFSARQRHAGNLFGTLAKGGRLDPLYLKVGQFFRSEETLVKAEKVPKAAGGRLGTSPERLLRRQTDRGPKIISYI